MLMRVTTLRYVMSDITQDPALLHPALRQTYPNFLIRSWDRSRRSAVHQSYAALGQASLALVGIAAAINPFVIGVLATAAVVNAVLRQRSVVQMRTAMKTFNRMFTNAGLIGVGDNPDLSDLLDAASRWSAAQNTPRADIDNASTPERSPLPSLDRDGPSLFGMEPIHMVRLPKAVDAAPVELKDEFAAERTPPRSPKI